MLVRRKSLIEVAAPVDAKNAQTSWHFRRSLLLTLEDEEGRQGYGEASPLPGWSRDSLASCRFAIEELPEMMNVPANLSSVGVLADAMPQRLPSVTFALETALLDLIAKRRNVSVATLIGAKRERLPLCPTKVKVGPCFETALAKLTRLREELGDDAPIRADFNQSLSGFRLKERLQRLVPLNLELVEEPAPLEALMKLEGCEVPLALDESLQFADAEIDQLAERGVIDALVIKPTVLGGLQPSLRLAKRAETLGLGVVVTHAFEGPIAHAMAAAIALALPGKLLPCGLSRHVGFDTWGERTIAHLEEDQVVSSVVPGLGVSA